MEKFFCFGLNDFCDQDRKCDDCEHHNNKGGVYREVITNADRIRAMTDEELATWIGDIIGGGIEWFDARSCERCQKENAGRCPHPEDGGCDKLDSVIEDWLREKSE